MNIESLINKMSTEELCGQLLCFNVPPELTEAEMESIIRETRAGGVFVKNDDLQKGKLYAAMLKKYSGIPGLLAADIEMGPIGICEGAEETPHSMALGACDDTELVEHLHRACAEICRENGINWTFSPVVDININPDNPITNNRAISDSTEQVIKIATAQIRGFQKDGLLMATCKHFPGDGVDDRNQHFCTSVNSLSEEEWMSTFGKVYKAMFEAGTAAVMVGHISLPALQTEEECNEVNVYKPGTLSYSLQTKLLREKLGFEGCIVSDAMSMVGACAAIPPQRLAVEFIKAGGDMLLYPLREDYDRILEAVHSGEIPMERLRDAVRHVLELKKKARLFEDESEVLKDISHSYSLREEADRVGEKSIKIVRNAEGHLPLSEMPGARILLIHIVAEKDTVGLPVLEEELKKRGYTVEVMRNPRHYAVAEAVDKFDCILVNCKLASQTYPGGSLRIGWEHIWPFWRGYIFRHPKVIFTSFGDPYKLYDFPFLKTYVNTFSDSPASQRGFVRILLGEVSPTAKNPVQLNGFFEREV